MCPMAPTQVCTSRKTLAAHGHSVRAAWVEATTARWINEAGNLTARQDVPVLLIRHRVIRVRCRGDQQLRVWMPGLLDHFLARSPLDGLPGIHDKRILGKVASAGNVMGDEEQSEPFFIFE